MDLIYIQIFFLVILFILIQFIVKWLFGTKIDSKDEMANQSRKDYHMIRRFQHMSTGLIMLVVWPHITQNMALTALGCGALSFLLMNIYRLLNPKFNEKYINQFGFLLRPHELNNMPGALYFLIGVFLSVLFFRRIEIYMSTIILSFGDPFASLCGIYFKSPKLSKDKSLAGTLGCSLVSSFIAMICYFFVNDFQCVNEKLHYSIFFIVTFIIAIFSELGPSSRRICLEDNVTIPIYAGSLYTAYFKYMEICED